MHDEAEYNYRQNYVKPVNSSDPCFHWSKLYTIFLVNCFCLDCSQLSFCRIFILPLNTWIDSRENMTLAQNVRLVRVRGRGQGPVWTETNRAWAVDVVGENVNSLWVAGTVYFYQNIFINYHSTSSLKRTSKPISRSWRMCCAGRPFLLSRLWRSSLNSTHPTPWQHSMRSVFSSPSRQTPYCCTYLS